VWLGPQAHDVDRIAVHVDRGDARSALGQLHRAGSCSAPDLENRFLREGGESEERLRADGRTYAGDARRRIAQRVTGSGSAVLLSALDRSFSIV
jgi:hypothetical protein